MIPGWTFTAIKWLMLFGILAYFSNIFYQEYGEQMKKFVKKVRTFINKIRN